MSDPTALSAYPSPFKPHPLLWNGHLQTVLGGWFAGVVPPIDAERVELRLDDGDSLVSLVSTPPAWTPHQPTVLLVHGLCGCAESSYLLGATHRFLQLGFRAARMNLRGAGSGFGLAREVYHAGRTEDVRAVAEALAIRSPASPIVLLGYSLGGNLVLKLAAEAADRSAPWLDSVIAVNPPIDLEACCDHLRSGPIRFYDRHFLRALRILIDRLHLRYPELGAVEWTKIRSLYEFDDRYTAPRNGFDGALDYYRKSSAGPLLRRIECPSLLVHAADDPFIPIRTFRDVAFPPSMDVEISDRGGHVGYISNAPRTGGGGRRWLDERLARWVSRRFLIPA